MRNKVKKIIPSGMLHALVSVNKKRVAFNNIHNNKYGTIDFASNRDFHIYEVPKKNVFFGYYDLQQFNSDRTKLLAHICGKNSNPAKDSALIAWFDRGNNTPHIISETNAWCWQQGSRLRWAPTHDECVMFNDFANGQYVCKMINIQNKSLDIVSPALYDLTPDGKYGLGLNFRRLQELRPGYGYSRVNEKYPLRATPKDDGLFRYDLTNGKTKMLFSLDELSKDIQGDYYHYLNHISISPDGSKFTFFHLWTKGKDHPWKMRFYVSNIDGTECKVITDQKCVSHYCWVDSDNMVITTSEGLYYGVNVKDAELRLIESSHLIIDGHPSALNGAILSDTYPQKDSMQYVFLYDGSYKQLLSIYSDPRLFGEKRCDLHPRLTRDGIITIDSSVKNGCRNIVEFQLSKGEIIR